MEGAALSKVGGRFQPRLFGACESWAGSARLLSGMVKSRALPKKHGSFTLRP